MVCMVISSGVRLKGNFFIAANIRNYSHKIKTDAIFNQFI